MNYISLALIAELNKELETSGKTGRIHVCDSCGGQSFRIEAENSEKAYEIIESFFSKRKIPIILDKKLKQFYPKQ